MDLNEEFGICRCCGKSFPLDEWDDDERCDDLCPDCYYSGREQADDEDIDDNFDDSDDFDDLDEPDTEDDFEEDDEWENEEPYLPPDEITNSELDRFNDN